MRLDILVEKLEDKPVRNFSLNEAQKRFAELCNWVAETGELCVISKAGMPIVKLIPAEQDVVHRSVWDSVEESRFQNGDLDSELEDVKRSGELRSDPLGDWT